MNGDVNAKIHMDADEEKARKEFFETLSNNMGHRDRVKKFCETHPNWNPIKGKWEE